jgi:hypothetical protein
MKTAREMSPRVMVPVGAHCELCKLSADPGDGGAFQLDVMYGGKIYGDEGNDLVALWRRPWLCEPCVKVINQGSRMKLVLCINWRHFR